MDDNDDGEYVLRNDKCPELPAGQFFSGAQIPSCIFVDVWPIDFIRGIIVDE